ncbi:uncharacterized protein [Venturia canescens]|uniref:uncharacterized protein n=1 Tax=Venturia canescens TaxID=32260 RepID=UPI001C9C7A1A|nr:uncharacterized protein LOC122410919 [Venturia canescens]
MPRHRERTTNKGRWTKEDLENARKLIIEAKFSMRVASKKYGIPFATLQRRMKMDSESVASGPSMGRKAVLSPAQEKMMVGSIEMLGELFYGLNCQQIRYLAYEFAERQNIMHNFNKEKKCAGRDWLEGFLKRNPTVRTRKPEPTTSTAKIAAFNYQDVSSFFNKLENVMREYYFPASRIYAVDETVITTVLEAGTLGIPGAHVERPKAKGGGEDRGKNVTVVLSMNAAGLYVPPMFIFPRQRMSQQLSQNGPTDAIYQCVKDGCINSTLFFIWLVHFKEHAKPTKEHPCLLILDNHVSHVSLKILDFCKKHGIILLPVPPHTSHRLQPLNIAFYGPLKKAFKKECDSFMMSQSLKNITQYELAEVFDKAYTLVADPLKPLTGFRVTGIYPLNRAVFTTHDFVSLKALQLATNSANSPESAVSSITATSQPSMGHFLYNMADNQEINVANASTTNMQMLCSDTNVEHNSFKPFPHTSTGDPVVY